jgi:hypothetical protein
MLKLMVWAAKPLEADQGKVTAILPEAGLAPLTFASSHLS